MLMLEIWIMNSDRVAETLVLYSKQEHQISIDPKMYLKEKQKNTKIVTLCEYEFNSLVIVYSVWKQCHN